jgi:hypothetical protein
MRARARAFSEGWNWICRWSLLGSVSRRGECQTPIPIIPSCLLITKPGSTSRLNYSICLFPGRVAIASGSMASGRGRFPWRAKRWWQSGFAAGSSGTNENRRSASPLRLFGPATEVPARSAGLLLENRARVLAFRESRYSRCASHSEAATGDGATKQRGASTQRGGYRRSGPASRISYPESRTVSRHKSLANTSERN